MKKPSLLIIFLTVFIDLIGFGIVLPLLPRYAERFGAHGFEIGAVISSFSLMQFFFSPWWGRLSDRIGRRPVLLISNGASALSYALFAVAAMFQGETGLIVLLISRVAGGICGANLSVASAYIADVTTAENRSKGMGMIGMAFGLGFILGPAIGAFAAGKWGLQAPGWVAAAICAGNFILGCFILVESRVPGMSNAAPRPKFAQWKHTLQQPHVGLLIAVFFLATFCFTCFETTLPLLLASSGLHFDETGIGWLFAYCGLMAAFVQGGSIGRLVKKFGEAKLIWMSLVVVAASLALIPLAAKLGSLLVALGLFAIGSGINRAPTMGLISKNSPVDEQGASLGVAQSFGSLARILGPLFATTLYAQSPKLPYFICGGIALAAGVIAMGRIHDVTSARPATPPNS
ncbi:MAG TPA: MFS transporter [Verrucomicrobiales bacterium]|nr:MFS transporter [Verrucomicrobiales bacterium]